MVRMSVLADALKTLYNAEKRGKRQVILRPSSKVIVKFLQLMQVHGKLRRWMCALDNEHERVPSLVASAVPFGSELLLPDTGDEALSSFSRIENVQVLHSRLCSKQ
jgi:hypothetical protein